MLLSLTVFSSCTGVNCFGSSNPLLQMNCKLEMVNNPDVYTLKTFHFNKDELWESETIDSAAKLKIDFEIDGNKLTATAYEKKGFLNRKHNFGTATTSLIDSEDDLKLIGELQLSWNQPNAGVYRLQCSNKVYTYEFKSHLTCYDNHANRTRSIYTPMISKDTPFVAGSTTISITQEGFLLSNIPINSHNKWNRVVVNEKFQIGSFQCNNFQLGDDLMDIPIQLECRLRSGDTEVLVEQFILNYGNAMTFSTPKFKVAIDVVKLNGVYQLRYYEYNKKTSIMFGATLYRTSLELVTSTAKQTYHVGGIYYYIACSNAVLRPRLQRLDSTMAENANHFVPSASGVKSELLTANNAF